LALKTFLRDTLIPKESSYFQPGTGLETQSGMPYDHLRIRLKESLLTEACRFIKMMPNPFSIFREAQAGEADTSLTPIFPSSIISTSAYAVFRTAVIVFMWN